MATGGIAYGHFSRGFTWSWHDLIVRGTWLVFCSQVLLVMSDLVRSCSLLFPVVESRLLV